MENAMGVIEIFGYVVLIIFLVGILSGCFAIRYIPYEDDDGDDIAKK